MSARFWGAHAPSRAGDDALVIANFFFSAGAFSIAAEKDCFGEDAAATDAKQRPGFQTSTRGACVPQKAGAASSHVTK